MQNQQYIDENQVNFGLLNDNDQIYKNTTNAKTTQYKSHHFIKLALIIFTSSAIISTVGIVSIYLLNSGDSDYNLAENINDNKQPVINSYEELKTDEDLSIPTEVQLKPGLSPEIDVNLIVEQMIILKKISLKSVKGNDRKGIPVPNTESSTTAAPKIVDYLLATIVINKATVPNKDGLLGLTDAFVKVFVDNRFIGQTVTQKETLNPVWNYQIIQDIKIGPNSDLEFEVWDSDKYTTHELIGKCSVKISDLMSNGSKGKVVDRNYGSGRLWFTINWEEVYKV